MQLPRSTCCICCTPSPPKKRPSKETFAPGIRQKGPSSWSQVTPKHPITHPGWMGDAFHKQQLHSQLAIYILNLLEGQKRRGGKKKKEEKKGPKPPNSSAIPPLQNKQLRAVYSSLAQSGRHLSPRLRSRVMNCSGGSGGMSASLLFQKPPNSGIFRRESAEAALEEQGTAEEARRAGRAAGRAPPAPGSEPLMAG